jgi:hypothetical protein
MDPNKFRESRLAINRLYEDINVLIEQNALEASKAGYEEVNTQLDTLTPQAEGEIQERSVKNLSIKIGSLLTHIDKLKPPKKKGAGGRKGTKVAIVWDEDRVGQLSPAFLKKVYINMGEDTDAKVCFGTTGKGIRPSYQVEFSNQKVIAFSGAGHGPQKKPLSTGTKKISQPFSHELIGSILNGK